MIHPTTSLVNIRENWEVLSFVQQMINFLLPGIFPSLISYQNFHVISRIQLLTFLGIFFQCFGWYCKYVGNSGQRVCFNQTRSSLCIWWCYFFLLIKHVGNLRLGHMRIFLVQSIVHPWNKEDGLKMLLGIQMEVVWSLCIVLMVATLR